MAKDTEMEVRKPSSGNTIMAGALLGAGAGAVAAMLLHRRAEKQEREHTVTPGEAIKIGLLVFGLLRAISALGDDD
jgi:gas vesicle protein